MDSEKKIEIHIPSIQGFEKVAMESAATAAKKVGFSDDRIQDLKTAVAEACINAIEHGNKMDTSTKVGIILTVEDDSLEVAVQDEGIGVEEVEHPKIEDKIKGQSKHRGWGMFLIKNLVNDVTFGKRPEGGNEVRMVIHLDKET
jgi:serine/threonine-protein kinase RsbW